MIVMKDGRLANAKIETTQERLENMVLKFFALGFVAGIVVCGGIILVVKFIA